MGDHQSSNTFRELFNTHTVSCKHVFEEKFLYILQYLHGYRELPIGLSFLSVQLYKSYRQTHPNTTCALLKGYISQPKSSIFENQKLSEKKGKKMIHSLNITFTFL